MGKYVAILRGINVSGQKMIRMDDLTHLLIQLGLKNVSTYIQSGNVLFESDITDIKEFTNTIEETIFIHFGFEVPVIIRSKTELEKIFLQNPFLKEKTTDVSKLHVTFLENEADFILSEMIHPTQYFPDEFKIIGKEIFLFCPNGYGRTKLTNTFFEKKLKVKATTRNWNTVKKLVEMIGK